MRGCVAKSAVIAIEDGGGGSFLGIKGGRRKLGFFFFGCKGNRGGRDNSSFCVTLNKAKSNIILMKLLVIKNVTK